MDEHEASQVPFSAGLGSGISKLNLETHALVQNSLCKNDSAKHVNGSFQCSLISKSLVLLQSAQSLGGWETNANYTFNMLPWWSVCVLDSSY